MYVLNIHYLKQISIIEFRVFSMFFFRLLSHSLTLDQGFQASYAIGLAKTCPPVFSSLEWIQPPVRKHHFYSFFLLKNNVIHKFGKEKKTWKVQILCRTKVFRVRNDLVEKVDGKFSSHQSSRLKTITSASHHRHIAITTSINVAEVDVISNFEKINCNPFLFSIIPFCAPNNSIITIPSILYKITTWPLNFFNFHFLHISLWKYTFNLTF